MQEEELQQDLEEKLQIDDTSTYRSKEDTDRKSSSTSLKKN